MENDSIRASGANTLIDIWVEGKLREICIASEAIDAFVGGRAGAEMSEVDRCDFVRRHLPDIVAAVKTKLRGDSGATAVVIDAGQLKPGGDRRRGDRRLVDRRRADRPAAELPQGERRRGERRRANRRRKPN